MKIEIDPAELQELMTEPHKIALHDKCPICGTTINEDNWEGNYTWIDNAANPHTYQTNLCAVCGWTSARKIG